MDTEPESSAEWDRKRLEERIGYTFRDPHLLRIAITHVSGAEHRLASYERMEFLGDAILGAVVCDVLYHLYPFHQEGDLTQQKSVIVSRQNCMKMSLNLGMDQFLILGKGVTGTYAIPQSLLADVFESLVAAIYLDGGLEAARSFILRQIHSIMDLDEVETENNSKSLLQQFVQRSQKGTPVYLLLDEKGPDHSKCFQMAVQIGNRQFPSAWGKNKKEAEQRAAKNALKELDITESNL